MKPTAIYSALAAIYGVTRDRIHSAAWVWFEWRRNRQGVPVQYRWRF